MKNADPSATYYPVAFDDEAEACHRGLYALVNSAAMNGVGPNTEISKTIFLPVTLSLVLAVIFWGSAVFCAVHWYRRRKVWKVSR